MRDYEYSKNRLKSDLNPDNQDPKVECDITIPKEQIDLMLVQSNIELIQRVNRQIELLDQKTETIHKINEYLRQGGLFNPEHMDPEAVRDMLIDIRDTLQGNVK